MPSSADAMSSAAIAVAVIISPIDASCVRPIWSTVFFLACTKVVNPYGTPNANKGLAANWLLQLVAKLQAMCLELTAETQRFKHICSVMGWQPKQKQELAPRFSEDDREHEARSG